MPPQILRMTLLAMMLLTSFYFAIGEDVVTKQPTIKPPKFTLHIVKSITLGSQQFFSLDFEVLNPNNASLVYSGYTPNSFDPPLKKDQISPLFHIELKQDEKWQHHPRGFCGTGLANLELTPHSVSRFSVEVPKNNWEAVKIGIGQSPFWSHEKITTTTIWSIELTRKEIEKKRL